MTILSIVQDAAVLCNMPRPVGVMSSNEDFEQEMVVLLKRAGEELIRRHDWGGLIRTQDYATNGTWTDFTVPDDFHRLVKNAAVSYGTTGFIRGGLSDAEWRLHARQSGATHRYRLIGQTLQIVPALSVGNTPATIQYVSKNWITTYAGGELAEATADTDVPVVPERLVTSCLVWMWKRLKKQGYQSDLAEYEDDLAVEISADRNFRVPTSGNRGAVAKMEAKA